MYCFSGWQHHRFSRRAGNACKLLSDNSHYSYALSALLDDHIRLNEPGQQRVSGKIQVSADHRELHEVKQEPQTLAAPVELVVAGDHGVRHDVVVNRGVGPAVVNGVEQGSLNQVPCVEEEHISPFFPDALYSLGDGSSGSRGNVEGSAVSRAVKPKTDRFKVGMGVVHVDYVQRVAICPSANQCHR